MDWSTVSVNLQKSSIPFNAFPNPFRHTITVEIPTKYGFDSIIVWNSSGQKVYEAKIADQSKVMINTRNWPRGAYIISLTSNDQIARKKVFRR